MFGTNLDYMLLHPLTHDRNLQREEEMGEVGEEDAFDLNDATARLSKLVARLYHRFPISSSLRYLDLACGLGDISLALAHAGCGHVTGVDSDPRFITRAQLDAQRLNLGKRVGFYCKDIHDWQPKHRFEVILSHEALEHIRDPRGLLKKMRTLLAPGGMAALAFGPLFYSPFGDHMNDFFRCAIPRAGRFFQSKRLCASGENATGRRTLRPTTRRLPGVLILCGIPTSFDTSQKQGGNSSFSESPSA